MRPVAHLSIGNVFVSSIGVVLCFWIVFPVCAQVLPDAPSHRFFDNPAKVRLGILAGLVTADGITTQRVIAHHHGTEINPLARPLVMQGTAGQVAASTLGYGIGVGSAFLLHRTGHHRLERWLLNASITVEAECTLNNLIQHSRQPRHH